MEATWWWLLAVPLFFGLGWLAARLDASQWLSETKQLPRSYFEGLNHLLNERPEQAIVAFEEVARLDPDTAELYFALGSLFRRRGETERAIRIHRNLLERADLPEAQREQALFNLGQDYLNAGIFDRAENAFSSLSGGRYAAQAQRELAKLYEKESNWLAAIDCLNVYLASTEGNHANSHISNLVDNHQKSATDSAQVKQDLSHYACEQALVCLSAHDADQAQHLLNIATKADPTNPRIAIYQAQILFEQHQPEAAIQTLNAVVTSNKKLSSIAVQALLHSKQDLTPHNINILMTWFKDYPKIDVAKQLLPCLEDEQFKSQRIQILAQLADDLKQTPASLGAAQAVLSNAANCPEYSTQWQQQVVSAMGSLITKYDRPVCHACGFKASRHHWRCPGCARWGTLPYTT